MKDKGEEIPATPVVEIVAHGDAEIGSSADQRIETRRPVSNRRSLAERVAEVRCFTPGSHGAFSKGAAARPRPL